MSRLAKLFRKDRCSYAGMVHLLPLPGSPLYGGNVQDIINQACRETEIYLKANIDSILVENMHDIPYVRAKELGPETTAIMTRVCTEIRRIASRDIPLGIQVLAGGNKEAIAVALAADFDYIRAEGFVFSHVADEGFTDACAGSLLRYRNSIGAGHIKIFTDIKKKHSSHAITGDVSLAEVAKAAEFFLSDGIILTGKTTGDPVDSEDLTEVRATTKLPILIGSGVTLENATHYAAADICIIGSHFKRDGKWNGALDAAKVEEFVRASQDGRINV